MSNLSLSEPGMWRSAHFFARDGVYKARLYPQTGAIPGIYKQIRESYITVIVPWPSPCRRRSSYKRVVYGEWQKKARDVDRERGGGMLASMSPFELIGIWINSPARPWRKELCQEIAIVRGTGVSKKKKRDNDNYLMRRSFTRVSITYIITMFALLNYLII